MRFSRKAISLPSGLNCGSKEARLDFVRRSSFSSQNLQLKLIGSHGAEDEQKLFTGLKARECLVQLSCQGELYSLAKAHTPDHCPPPNKAIPTLINSRADLNSQKSQPVFAFSITTEFSALEIMQQNSTNRKPLKLIPKGKTS